MKQAVKLSLLCMLMLTGCFRSDRAGPWAHEHSETAEALSVNYRCDHLALEPGDVFAIELDVQLPIDAEEPTIEIGLGEFSIVEALKRPTQQAEGDALLRRYRWVLQAVAPLDKVTSAVAVHSIILGQTNQLRFAHAPIVVKSILSQGEDPLTLPVFDTAEATP